MEDRFQFRYFHHKTKKMYDVKKICFDGEPLAIVAYNPILKYRLIDGYLMQCTGLKDKNGKLIYEGDIINIWCKNLTKNQISEVNFCKERAAFTFDYLTDYGAFVPCTMEKTEIEVIGNIYENTELR